jgi:hypothetical protein
MCFSLSKAYVGVRYGGYAGMQPSKLARELHHEVLCALLRPRLYLLTLKKNQHAVLLLPVVILMRMKTCIIS